MDFSKIPQKLVARIQGIIRLQESEKAVGNIEAAANYADQISKILLKYNLDINDVTSVNYEEPAVIVDVELDTREFEKSHEGGWVLALARVIARANMCRVISSSKSTRIWIVGTKTNADMVWYITEQMVNRLRPIKAEEWSKYTGYEKRNTWARGFFAGAVVGIGEQLMRKEQAEEQKAREQEAQEQAGVKLNNETGTALMTMRMVEKEAKRVNEYLGQRFGRLGVSNKRGTSSQGGKATGYATGKSMSIHGGVGSGQRRLG